MSDYTPTTEEVRNKFWLGEHSVSKTDWSISEAEFNRWLAEVKADAYENATKALTIGPTELIEIRAQAWEEGYIAEDVGLDMRASNPYRHLTENTYRQGEEQ